MHTKWLNLHHAAANGPLPTRNPSLQEYLEHWLRHTLQPYAKPKTLETYRLVVRLYICPWLGRKPLAKLTARDVRRWLDSLATACQCCVQGKDATRTEKNRRCCAIGRCCRQHLSRRTILDARAILRSALADAISDNLISRNPAAEVKLPKARTRRLDQAWTVDEARQFLTTAHHDSDPLYPAYVLLLCLGLRRGELLALRWNDIDLGESTVTISHELQRIAGQLVVGETKTLDSDARLPLPGLAQTALLQQARAQSRLLDQASSIGTPWSESGHVITTSTGTPLDPHNFYRSFQRRCVTAGVLAIPVHGTRHTCASLLVALDVHPRVAMQILRHAKIATTMDIYTHVPTPATSAALAQLSEQLDIASVGELSRHAA